MSGSFRLQRGSSTRIGRSNSLLLVSETISSDSARFTGYERLSQSMRLGPDEQNHVDPRHQLKKKTVFLLSRIFSRSGRQAQSEKKEQIGRSCNNGEKKKKSWYSAWVPDPNQRWPVQGW